MFSTVCFLLKKYMLQVNI